MDLWYIVNAWLEGNTAGIGWAGWNAISSLIVGEVMVDTLHLLWTIDSLARLINAV